MACRADREKSLAISLSSNLVFFLGLVEETDIDRSSIYDREKQLDIVSNKGLIYIKKRIGEIGLPWGIPAEIGEKSWVWLLKDSRSWRVVRKEFTQAIRLVGRPNC